MNRLRAYIAMALATIRILMVFISHLMVALLALGILGANSVWAAALVITAGVCLVWMAIDTASDIFKQLMERLDHIDPITDKDVSDGRHPPA